MQRGQCGAGKNRRDDRKNGQRTGHDSILLVPMIPVKDSTKGQTSEWFNQLQKLRTTFSCFVFRVLCLLKEVFKE